MRGTVVNFGVKIDADKKENQDTNWVGWIVLEVGVRYCRPLRAEANFLEV